MKKIIIIAIALIAAATGVYFILGNKPTQPKMSLQTDKVSKNSITNSVTATGTVEPVTEVEVGTQVSGIVSKLYVDYNDVVKAGQLIAEMDKINLQAELKSANAQLAGNRTEYQYQQKNYARSKMLFEKQLISDYEYETATYQYEKAKAAYEQSEAAMVKVRRNLEYATITSPIDGVIINRAVEEGQTVAAGFETPTLFTIARDMTQMQVIADVDEADIGNVKEGQRVTFTVDAFPNDEFQGVVTQIRLGVSSSSGSSATTSSSSVVTYEVVIGAQNPDLKLIPRLTANVTIYTLERNDVLTIPHKTLRFVPDNETLQQLGLTVKSNTDKTPAGKRVVWVKNGNEVMAKAITVGTGNASMIEIVDGLSEGEEVVVDVNTMAAQLPQPQSGERSPFMPSHPGANKKTGK
ncbi:MAG: efflux RND transporter periplasmic adaptor subunit [Marinifilaceae bacterium]